MDFFLCMGEFVLQSRSNKRYRWNVIFPPYARHRGIEATSKAVESFFYRPSLRKTIDAFVQACIIFHKAKYDTPKASRLFHPLPIPDRPWESITIYFVFDLPRMRAGNDGIWTIVDRFNKQARFIPVKKKINVEHMVKLFMYYIFSIIIRLRL